ncbi:hypothetical protein BgiBS90_003404, partial [Biomphalaria glabrata]
ENDEDRTVGINTGHIQTLDYNLETADKEFVIQVIFLTITSKSVDIMRPKPFYNTTSYKIHKLRRSRDNKPANK